LWAWFRAEGFTLFGVSFSTRPGAFFATCLRTCFPDYGPQAVVALASEFFEQAARIEFFNGLLKAHAWSSGTRRQSRVQEGHAPVFKDKKQ